MSNRMCDKIENGKIKFVEIDPTTLKKGRRMFVSCRSKEFDGKFIIKNRYPSKKKERPNIYKINFTNKYGEINLIYKNELFIDKDVFKMCEIILESMEKTKEFTSSFMEKRNKKLYGEMYDKI